MARAWDCLGRGNVSGRAVKSDSGSGAAKGSKITYVCEDCGNDFAQWHGKCPSCSSWNSLKQFRVAKVTTDLQGGGAVVKALSDLDKKVGSDVGLESGSKRHWVSADERPKLLREIETGKDEEIRLRFSEENGEEFGRVLGGGIVPGSMTLVGGDPGVGKSTLLLQVASWIQGCGEGNCVLYVSGEESTQQLALRANRLSIDVDSSELYLYSATNLEDILLAIAQLKPAAVVVDSIQTVYLPGAKGAAGSVSQIRECATSLLQLAKKYKIATFVIGHVTKMGEIAGPRVLEHLVDVVLYLEGERFERHRLLRSVKNRFGAADEIGVFRMGQDGLSAVLNPSELFSSHCNDSMSGDISPAITATMEGTRPLLVEIQALCSDIKGTDDTKCIRSANGINFNKLCMLLAVLSKSAGVFVGNQSLFINVTGGLRLQEPATDLAVLMAIASSYLSRPISPGTVFIGEVGLGGELRPVGQVDRRVAEAAKVGFKKCILPRSFQGYPSVGDIELIPCSTVKEVIQKTLGTKPEPAVME